MRQGTGTECGVNDKVERQVTEKEKTECETSVKDGCGSKDKVDREVNKEKTRSIVRQRKGPNVKQKKTSSVRPVCDIRCEG